MERPTTADLLNKAERDLAYWRELLERHPAPDPSLHGTDAHMMWAYWRDKMAA